MASTPSASALSAVLRCQGNILARKQANKKRPRASVTHGDSVKSYFRSLWGFLFHRKRVDIPGVLSVTARLQPSCSGKSSIRNCESKEYLVKKSPKFDSKMLTKTANQWPKTKVTSDYSLAFKSSSSSLVLRLDHTLLGKLNSENPRTLCICVVCAQGTSTLNHNSVNALFSLGLLWSLKDKLIYLTNAVSDGVRTKLGAHRNQLHPDCDKLSGCVKCASQHHEDEPKTRS